MRRTVAETGSTNDDMAALVREGAPEGAWLRADRQTRGRGRRGRAWVSPPGNLYASTLVRRRPGDPPTPTLAFVAGLALDAAAARWIDPARLQLKWPNDLLVAVPGWAKLAGILLEASGGAVVAGFGVNLAHHPADLDRPAASLASAGVAPPSPDALLDALAGTFAAWLARWRTEGFAPIRREWLARAHSIGTPLSVTPAAGERLDGAFDGLDAAGALRLRLAGGGVHVMHAGDVFLGS